MTRVVFPYPFTITYQFLIYDGFPICYPLKGRVALITGGASGIGLAIAERFVREGAKVIVADLNKESMEQAKEKLGDACTTVVTHVKVEADIESAVARSVEQFGRLDIGVTSAGIGGFPLITEQTEERWNNIIGACLNGVFLSMKHEGRQIQALDTDGVIINISSLNSRQPGWNIHSKKGG